MTAQNSVIATGGSVIYGEEAVSLGLIDHLGSLSDALGCLHEMMKMAQA